MSELSGDADCRFSRAILASAILACGKEGIDVLGIKRSGELCLGLRRSRGAQTELLHMYNVTGCSKIR